MDEEDPRHNVIECVRSDKVGPGYSYEAQVTRDTRTDVTTLHLVMRYGKAIEYYRLAHQGGRVTIDEHYASVLLLIKPLAPHLRRALAQEADYAPFMQTLEHIVLMQDARGRPC